MLPVRALREELMWLHEPGSYVGEVIKVMGKDKVGAGALNSPSCTPSSTVFFSPVEASPSPPARLLRFGPLSVLRCNFLLP